MPKRVQVIAVNVGILEKFDRDFGEFFMHFEGTFSRTSPVKLERSDRLQPRKILKLSEVKIEQLNIVVIFSYPFHHQF